jgi:hypothetical protein
MRQSFNFNDIDDLNDLKEWEAEIQEHNRKQARARLAGPLKFGFLFIALIFFCFVLASKCHAQSRVVGVPDTLEMERIEKEARCQS